MREIVWQPASCEAETTFETTYIESARRQRKVVLYSVFFKALSFNLLVMSANLEYRERERQRKRDSRRQTSEAQREKEQHRARARDKKQRRHF